MEYRQTRLLMQFFIASEALFFVALIVAYVYFRNLTDDWAESAKYLDIRRTGIFTIFLFSSSGTITVANWALRKQKRGVLVGALVVTIVFGAIFLAGQATEYYMLYERGVKISMNIFGSAFFTLTGFHGFHVFVGLIILSVFLTLVLLGSFKGNGPFSAFLATEWYWHFVDAVWVFVFFFVYLRPLL
ncbi:hypothetical protein FUAX_48550 (plasmid) [Fulvitalea axinellae]|uniref:cytochrome-c oxidase n=1 Tax=Fulvitalea axinellae TaxID=1182444 RepID=A0AAU9CWS1_9BACT|nr:hypothetical protein FUAX_48550 [Fulvitalea axinellae]